MRIGKKISAVIFDMDDTLVATAATWTRAETRLFRQLGRDYDPVIAQTYKGMNAGDVGRTIHRALRPADVSEADCARFMREYLREAFRGELAMMPGADRVLPRLAAGVPLGIASGSPLEVIREVLAHFQWREYFQVLVSSEEVAHGKPAPDVFLEAARRLRCAPADCLVIEDSLHGVRAARNAGMRCFVVPSSADPRIAAQAGGVFASLAEIELNAAI